MSFNWPINHDFHNMSSSQGVLPLGPAAGKRNNAAVREPEEDETTRKRLKSIWKSDKKAETLEEALEEIDFLKTHLKTALEFIDKTKTGICKLLFLPQINGI